MSDDPATVVTSFIAEFKERHPDVERLISYFTEDAVYHNMPARPVRGIEPIRNALSYTEKYDFQGWQIVNQAVNGNVVLNERLDHYQVGAGLVSLPVAGVFEIRDGKIAAWRDYFDLNQFQTLMTPLPEGEQ